MRNSATLHFIVGYEPEFISVKPASPKGKKRRGR